MQSPDRYHRILDLLNPHEWRDVQKRINQRSFQKDILAESPPEIAVQIAQYLDLSDLFILQRVCSHPSWSWGKKMTCHPYNP